MSPLWLPDSGSDPADTANKASCEQAGRVFAQGKEAYGSRTSLRATGERKPCFVKQSNIFFFFSKSAPKHTYKTLP